MDKIETMIINPEAAADSERMMVAMARLTQRAHTITNMEDFKNLLEKPYTPSLAGSMAELPHSTIKRFGMLHVAIIGASRRFLAQARTYQVGVTYVSGSLQYSDYSDSAQFCVPYEILEAGDNSLTMPFVGLDNTAVLGVKDCYLLNSGWMLAEYRKNDISRYFHMMLRI